MKYRSILPFVVFLFLPGAAYADHLSGLAITGVPANAIVGAWPVDSEYSWLSNRFPQAGSPHSWRLHPGTDGGILLGQAQPSGSLTAEFLMFNIPTTIFSVGNGITLNANEDINMDNLRKLAGQTVTDLGSGSGADPIVPLVPDITALAAGENGWQLNADGSYHIIYNTQGSCADCEMIIHFYGNTIPVTPDGDINGDGNVTITDVLLAERYLFGLAQLTPGQIAHGDLAPAGQGDGALTIADVYRLISLLNTAN
ncbi:MAG TPA: hypothetical protein ENK49_08215 [Gammaproteobacteria bacterium]|nr:hypothetical protein [Gammaproteobacteria bacterium]